VTAPDPLRPRPQVIARMSETSSLTLIWRSACDMSEIAFTTHFAIQAEGREVLFQEDATQGW
jgi:hypothetical protein